MGNEAKGCHESYSRHRLDKNWRLCHRVSKLESAGSPLQALTQERTTNGRAPKRLQNSRTIFLNTFVGSYKQFTHVSALYFHLFTGPFAMDGVLYSCTRARASTERQEHAAEVLRPLVRLVQTGRSLRKRVQGHLCEKHHLLVPPTRIYHLIKRLMTKEWALWIICDTVS